MPINKPLIARARPAYVEDADSEGERVRGTRKIASLKKKFSKAVHSSRPVKKEARNNSRYSSGTAVYGSDVSSMPRRRRKSTAGYTSKSLPMFSIPPSVYGNTNQRGPQLAPLEIPQRPETDLDYFELSPGYTPLLRPSNEPRTVAARSQSSYNNRPPPARSGFHGPPLVMPQPTSYPTASRSIEYWMDHATQSGSYFSTQPQSRPLAERFEYHSDPIQRSASAIGDRDLIQAVSHAKGYENTPGSTRRKSQELEGYQSMLPPPRLDIWRPSIRRKTTIHNDVAQDATGYQEEAQGSPSITLTAEALRRSQRPSDSSRSTRSSGSSDQTDIEQQSLTTRTTMSRNVDDDDNITFRLKGGTIMKVGGAEIKCDDGAEVQIRRRKSIRNGSERSSEYSTTDDRQSRSSPPVTLTSDRPRFILDDDSGDDGRLSKRESRTIYPDGTPRRRSSLSGSRADNYKQGKENNHPADPGYLKHQDGIRHASGYQGDVDSRPSVNFTAEASRQSQSSLISGYSTQSGGSRHEVAFKSYESTRTGAAVTYNVYDDNDDISIKVKGASNKAQLWDTVQGEEYTQKAPQQDRLQNNANLEQLQPDFSNTASQQNCSSMATSRLESSSAYSMTSQAAHQQSGFSFVLPSGPGGLEIPQQHSFVLQRRQPSNMSHLADYSLEFPSTVTTMESSSSETDLKKRIIQKVDFGRRMPSHQRTRKPQPLLDKPLYHQIPRKIPRLQNSRKVLRILIGKKQHLACPDSGSEQNIMSDSFVSSQGFDVRQEMRDVKQFELGNGKRVWSIGRVYVPVELIRGPLRRRKRWFYVLSNCPVDIILGRPFIAEAEVLTRYRDMLEDCPVDIGAISSFLWIGSPRCRTACSLDGLMVSAVADTGSDLNLMSLDCAKRGKYHIDEREDARRLVRVGDGSEVSTVGQVYVYNLSLDWREKETPAMLLPASSEPMEPTADEQEDSEDPFIIFHVMPGLSCDMILGSDLLYNLDAFNKIPDLLGPPLSEPLELDKDQLDTQPYELKIMISAGFISRKLRVTFRRQEATPAPPRPDDERTKHRAAFAKRLKNRDMISSLSQDMQELAKVVEEERILRYERDHETCRYCHP